MTVRLHDDQVEVEVEVVRGLVATQFPQWADQPVTVVPSAGTVNAVFRIGEDLLARLPLQQRTSQDVPTELAALRELHGATRFATPEVVAEGVAGQGYPFNWVVLRRLPGTPADELDTAELTGLAVDLAEFVRAVRDLPLHGRKFSRPGRGGDLHAHDGWMAECFARSEEVFGAGTLDVAALRELWSRYRTLPHVSADVVTHGDLVPGNLLVTGGRLAGVLDAGQLGPADPALDLIAGWHLFDRPAREVFRRGVGGEELDWVRGQAWAFQQAVGLGWYYVTTNPRASSLGLRTLARILDDPWV